MKLIREEVEAVEVLTEEKVMVRNTFHIQGPFLQGDVKNRNGQNLRKLVSLAKEVNQI